MMSIGHLVYIPLVGLLGLAWGYVLGANAARQKFDAARKRSEQ